MINFTEAILYNLKKGGDNIACKVNDSEISYSQFSQMVAGIQAKLQRTGAINIGIITQNHEATYAAIVATWLTGKCYVPINPSYPVERNKTIFKEADIQHILYAEADAEIQQLADNFPTLQLTETRDIKSYECFNTSPSADRTAYILFTSGTTGKPKGVPITFGNLQSFLNGFDSLGYNITEHDRFLQMFELTFDLSVVCFTRPLMSGASFYTLPSGMIRTLGLYQVLEDSGITFSLMVPSAIGLLAPYMDDIHLPELKISQFCGEALKGDLVQKWAQCVPNARIDNVYGPTEATIYCTSLTLNPKRLGPVQSSGIVAIGKSMKHCETCLINENLDLITAANSIGELCLSGEQVTPGYLNNPAQNEKSFIKIEGKRFYRTGDLVFKDENGCIFYLGRTDDQIKIQGYRVELGEIEVACSKILPSHRNVAVGFQDTRQNWFIALFIENLSADEQTIKEEVAAILPEYMKPAAVFTIDSIPLNANGKTDRKQLKQLAEALFST